MPGHAKLGSSLHKQYMITVNQTNRDAGKKVITRSLDSGDLCTVYGRIHKYSHSGGRVQIFGKLHM